MRMMVIIINMLFVMVVFGVGSNITNLVQCSDGKEIMLRHLNQVENDYRERLSDNLLNIFDALNEEDHRNLIEILKIKDQTILNRISIDLKLKYNRFHRLLGMLEELNDKDCEFWRNLFRCTGVKDINIRNHEGDTLLIYAIRKHNLNLLKLLLEFPKIDVNVSTKLVDLNKSFVRNYSALIFACYDYSEHSVYAKNQKEIIRLLINHPKTDFSKRDECQNSPLILLARNDAMDLVELMLQRTVDPDYIKSFAYKAKNMGIESRWKWSNFFPIVQRINLVNAKNISDETALSVAVDQGNVKMTKMLLNYGAEDTICEHEDVLANAVFLAHDDMVEYLIRKGIDIVQFEDTDFLLKALRSNLFIRIMFRLNRASYERIISMLSEAGTLKAFADMVDLYQ